MPRSNLSAMRTWLSLSQFAAGSAVLFQAMRRRFTTRTGAAVVGCEPGAQAANVLRAQSQQAWFSAGQRVAVSRIHSRRLHLPRVRPARRQIERGSYSALRAIPRPAFRVVEWAHTLRDLPQENADLRLARLLAQAPSDIGQADGPGGDAAVMAR